MKYWKNLKYLLKHKYYVLVECWKRGLYWRGLVHDNSKFLPSEFIPYANHFFGEKRKLGKAWLLHQRRNKHHWQWWILIEDNGRIKILEIEKPYLIEMICDWIGAAKAQGHYSPPKDPLLATRNWYNRNKNKMILHPKSRLEVERILEIS